MEHTEHSAHDCQHFPQECVGPINTISCIHAELLWHNISNHANRYTEFFVFLFYRCVVVVVNAEFATTTVVVSNPLLQYYNQRHSLSDVIDTLNVVIHNYLDEWWWRERKYTIY